MADRAVAAARARDWATVKRVRYEADWEKRTCRRELDPMSAASFAWKSLHLREQRIGQKQQHG